MNGQDYFSTVKYEPPKPRPKGSKLPLIIGGVLLAFVLLAAAGGALLLRSGSGDGGSKVLDLLLGLSGGMETLGPPPAAVLVGEPFAWRDLASTNWLVSTDRPRAGLVTGDFTGDGNENILLIDFVSKTTRYNVDGSSDVVQEEKWKLISNYISWDCDRDGVSELVPDSLLFTFIPDPTGFIRVRTRGG
ncbi:hypothetical protein IIA79_06560 [bacterium]|nr:hypothetical protein [bacterium]